MRYPLALLLLALSAGASAATLIESKTGNGQQSMWVQGTETRVEGEAGMPGYVLMDFAEPELLFVNEREELIITMGDHLTKEPPPEVEGARLTEVGPGPQIAGFDTTHYRLQVGNEVCSESYVSQSVVEEAGLEELAAAAQQIYSPPLTAQDPCSRAEAAFEPQLIGKGFVLRSVENGQVRREVTSVQTGVELPAGALDAPDYERLTMAEMQRRMMEKMKEQQQGGQPQ